jgi:hypothetical protein
VEILFVAALHLGVERVQPICAQRVETAAAEALAGDGHRHIEPGAVQLVAGNELASVLQHQFDEVVMSQAQGGPAGRLVEFRQ